MTVRRSTIVSADKATLRTTALAARDALGPEQRAEAARAVAARGLPFEVAPGAVVAGYAPIRSEFDPMPLLKRLAGAGARLALPVIVGRDHPLQFRGFSLGEALERGPLGIRQPTAMSAELAPDIMLVPLAAFDRSGHRIGYGAGYYDRTLEGLHGSHRPIAVGLAFAVQKIDAVPWLPHDAVLDYVLTETQAFAFRSK
jgi:5-formyltetrahydrofolate cyclo-ligase